MTGLEPTGRPGSIWFRADASPRIGTGHVMRCLALAAACRDRGFEPVFISQGLNEVMAERIRSLGCGLKPVAHSHPDPRDLDETMSIIESGGGISSEEPGWLVLDGYHFDRGYQRAVRKAGLRLLILDDDNNRDGYEADILLNQNVTAKDYSYRINSEAQMLLGTRYALLRPEFLKVKPALAIADSVGRVLVTLGGADPDQAVIKVLEAFERLEHLQFEARIVLGPANPHGREIEKMMNRTKRRIQVIPFARDMSTHLAWADLAVSAAGSTLWELCFLGIPTLAVVLAENQESIARRMHDIGAIENLGPREKLTPETIAEKLLELMGAPRRQSLAAAARALVDGRGAERVVEALFPRQLRFRPVRSQDCEQVFNWSNDPVTRSASFQAKTIEWPEHVEWFTRRLNDPDTHFYIVESDSDELLGQIRFQFNGQTATVSVSIDPGYRGLGVGSRLIREGCLKYRAEHPGIRIEALIKPENKTSIDAFAAANFIRLSDREHQGAATVAMTFKG